MHGVLRARGFKGGMHGQLGQTDVHGIQGDLGVGNVAEGRAAGHVRAIGVGLSGYAGAATDQLEQPRRDGVTGVALVGVVLDDHAVVHIHGMVLVGVFGVVGMHGVAYTMYSFFTGTYIFFRELKISLHLALRYSKSSIIPGYKAILSLLPS